MNASCSRFDMRADLLPIATTHRTDALTRGATLRSQLGAPRSCGRRDSFARRATSLTQGSACALIIVLLFAGADLARAAEPPATAPATLPVATAAASGGTAADGATASVPDPAAGATDRFDAANAAFAAGRYEDAIAGFQSIVASDGYSPSLLFDLANAYLRAGHLGEAILWYERARLLAPRDPDIAANLRQARRAANLPLPPEGDAWSRLEERVSPDGWSMLASAALFLAAALALAARFGRARRTSGTGRLLALGIAAAIVLAAGAALLAAARLRASDRAVILGPDPALRVAPYEEATVSSALDPGDLVRVERNHEGFRLVRTEDGRAGWVRDASAQPIVPR